MSSWPDKLEKRLNALADGASKESIQTLAKWIGFNRKHGAAFATSIAKGISAVATTSARKFLYWQVVHEVLLQEKDTPKWDRLENLRVSLGETVVLPLFKDSDAPLMDKLKPMLDQWDEVNVFGGPTLINQVKRSLNQSKSSPEATKKSEAPESKPSAPPLTPAESDTAPAPAPTPTPTKKPPAQGDIEETKAPAVDTKASDAEVSPKKEPPKLQRRASEQINFDFESQGIPAEKVEAREFLEPCKAIATLQIARDLRSDTAVRLPTILSSIPDEVKQLCEVYRKQQEETGSLPEIPEDVITMLSTKLGDDVLDLNIEEAIENVQTFREIVQKMRTARKRLAHLLIKSRCRFGSEEAAEAFYGLEVTIETLQKRREILSDAMDLEGLDFEEEPSQGTSKNDEEKTLDPFSWHPREPDAKRVKLT